jgi:DNA-binding transcriptional MerR regulator
VKKKYSISDLASEFSITTRTIRFYEEKGYLNPERNGMRRIYSSADRTRLRLILRGKRLGLTLDETADMIKMYGTPRGNQKQLEKFLRRIAKKRTELERKQRDLQVMLDDLQQVEDKCQLALAEYSDELNDAVKVN